MTDLALKKIDEEVRGFKGDKREQVMYKPVADALREFCRQQPEFAQAVYQSKKTFADCMKHVAKGVGSSISDIEAYRRAVEFYFPGAQVEFRMVLYMSKYDMPQAEPEQVQKKAPKQEQTGMVFDLLDLL